MSDQNKKEWASRIPVDHPWVALDLDGTLMEDGHYPDFGKPRPGAKAACEFFRSHGIKVMVFTARTSLLGLDGKFQNVVTAIQDVMDWAVFYEIPIDYVYPFPKPTFVLAFFDDRAIHVGKDVDAWAVALEQFEKTFGPTEKITEDWKRKLLPPEVKDGS